MHMNQLLTLALSIATAEAAYKGFNYGSTKGDRSARTQSDFQSQFKTAKSLQGTDGFNSARLYTMIQGGTDTTPIEAIPAAIEEDTSLLLGLWTSGGGIDKEVAALRSAISQYGESFTKLVVGISVGSEDLYRNSVTGAKSNAGIGQDPEDLISCIKKVKEAISGTSLSGASIGHVDTWDAWTNSSNAGVIDEIDWLGFDTYPYYQTTDDNTIDNAKSLFDEAVAKTNAVAKGKEIWITETGWPVSGKSTGKGVPSIPNAEQYWHQVGCPLFDKTNTWWYILEDEGASPSFGVTGADLSTTPLYDLRCSNSSRSSSASSSSATGKTGSKTGSKVGSSAASSISGFASSSGFAIKSASATSSFHTVTASTSTPYVGATKTASASTGSTGSSNSGSSSGSSGSSSSGSSSDSSSSSSSSSASASSTPTQVSAAGRPSGSIFGAVVAAIALAIAV